MASQEEDNKLECLSNVNKDQESYFLEVYKKHESILNNKNEPFENKIESLIDIWKTVGELNLSEFDLRHVIQIMDWAKLHALNIVLTAEWNGFKETHQSKLIDEIEKAQNELFKLNDGFATRCKKLADVVKNPWEDPVLMKLMKTKDIEVGPEEIEFFCVETAYLVSVRLKKLCESHCEDLALNLVTAFMNCKKQSKEQNFNLNLSETQMWFIFDIYIALLYKFQEKQKIVVLLKELSFEEGLQLIKRFVKKRVKIAKIWKNCQRVAVLALQMYISQTVVKYTEDLKDILRNYLEIYLTLCNTDSLLQDFTTSIRRISNLADASGLYLFCDVIQKMAGSKLKPFVIEMYIRALTTDMNELERQKDAKEDAKAEATTSRLAAAFCSLADFLSEHINVARECVLTAFSLEPTKERLNSIEEFARKSGHKVLDTGQEWKCKLHPPVLPSDEITWICSECGDWMCKPQLNLPKINMTLNEALQTSVLGISEALCDDLVVCLSNPRYQILSWFLPWDDLHRLCIMYLQDPQTTKNFVTELKFVDIDYSIFKGIKKEPVDELAGIERGYEQYLDHDFVSGEESSSDSEDSMSQDSRPYSLGSDGAGESFYIPLLPVQQKSDPNTLKSLRMFRPNLKRKDKDPEERIPEKIAKQEPSSTITSNSYRGIPESNSLSHFLNGTGQNMLPPQQDPDSKNVKTATLPLLGGQVAKNEVKSIQVHLQNLNTQKLLENSKVPTDQALKPYNQSTINSISGILKKELTIRLLNKPLLSGSKENNSHNISSSNSKTQISSQYQDIKTYSRIPQKTIKETKLQPTAIEPTAENKQLQEGITPHKAQPEQIPVLQVPVALEQPLLVPQANAETVVTQQKQQTMPLTLSCCQRTQLVDIKYQKRCWKSQPTIPPSQCKSSNQESNQKLPQSLSSDLKRPTIGEANNLDLECSTNQIPKTLNNSKTTLKLEEQLEVVDLTKESLQNLNHSPNLMAKQRIQAVVDLTLPSVAVTDSNRKQQTNIPIVDLTHPNLDPERSPSCNELLVPNSKQATSNPPNQVQNQCTLKNKLPETNSSQIDQQAIPQSPAKKAKTIDKAVNTCRQLYQIQKQYIERLQKPLRAQKLQEQAQISLPKQHSVSLPLKDQEKQSMTCSPTLAQQQQTIKVDLQSSTCFPKSDQIQSQVIIENPLTAGTQLPLQMQISTTSNQNPAKAMADSQANCTQDQVKSQNAIPVTQTKKPTLVQEQKEVKNLEKPSTNCSLNSLTLTTPQVLQNSFQNLDQSKIMNEQEIRPPTSPKRQLQNQINPAKTPATLKVILSKGKLPLSINSKSTSPLSSHQSQTFIHSTSPTQSQSHKDEIQNCPLQLPLEPRKQLEEQKGPQARNQAVNQDKYQSCHSLQKSYKSVQQELHQSKSPPYCQTQPNLELHIPVFSIPKNQSADLDQPPNRKQFLNEHPKQEKSMDKMADRSNRQQAQLKAGLIKLPSLRKSITRGCKSETLTTDSSNQPTKLGRHKNTLANRKQLQNGSCSSLKVPNLFPNSERQPLPRSQLKEPNITVPLPAQCSPNEISQLQRHLERPPLLVPVRSNKIPIELQEAQQIAAMLPNRSSQLSELKILKENEPNQTSNQLFRGDLLRNSCSSLETANKMDIEGANANDTSSNSDDNVDIEKNLAEMFGDEVKLWQKCTDINDNGLFSDAVGFEEDQMLLNNNNYSNIVKDIEVKDVFEDLPKNSNLTENIRTYAKKIRMKKDCVKKLLKGEIFNMSKNVNSTCNILPHSNVQNIQGKDKELKVVLCRLLTSKSLEGKLTICKEEYCTKQKCDRGKVPPRHSKRRKSIEKSENKVSKMSVTGQNYSISPLQDINPRVSPKVHLNSCCDLKSNSLAEDKKSINGKGCSEKNYARSVLANVPGLNDFQMIRPSNVNQIVNVVQVSGGRVTQNVPIQNTQTSTQVTPHIQRIGQPRIPETKTEPSTTTSTTTMVSAALTTTTKTTTTSQPSTLINILSQQVIRPVTTQANVVKRTPMINILSQQIIRPVQTPKTTTNTVTVSENNQTKPATTTAEQTLINPGSNLAKTTGAVKTVNTVTPGHGGTILQFICKSSLPKFQQAFGKTVYQNNTETVDSTTSTVDTGSTTTEPKKATVAKAVPVNVQPIQGSVIYSRQVPVGQTISLIPPGGTRQVFRIATTNPEQLLVKDSVIHSKMSALLAAALQGRAKTAEGGEVQINCDEATKVTLTRPTLVQNARIVKPVQLQLPTNVVRSTPQANLSSTTLEQLREFDMVYKQIKERSSTSTPAENANCGAETQEVTPQRISVTYVNQLPKYTQLSPVVVVTSYSSLQPAASPALSVTSQGSSSPCVTPSSTPTLPKITTKAIKGKTLKTTPPAPTNNTVTATTAAAKASPSIPKPQQKPQEDEHTTQRIFDILAEYAEQLRNSPDLNNKPAPRRRSNPPTNPSQNSKRKKSSSSAKKSGQSSSSNIDMDADDLTVGSEDSSGGNIIQLSVTDDEQSQAATITTPESNENSSSSSRQLILTETTTIGAQPRNLIIADSSVGEALKMSNAVIVPGNYIMPVSMVKGGQQIAVVSGGSKILATVPARTGQNMLLLQSFTNQNRKGGISTVKYSALQPISGISSQTLAGVSAQPPVILPPNSVTTAVALGQPLTLKKIGDDKETSELVFTISPAKEPPKLVSDVPQPDSSTNIAADSSDIKVEQLKLEPVKTESNVKIEHNLQPANSNDKLFHKYQKTVINSVGTSVIATTLKQDDSAAQTINVSLPSDGIKADTKPNERMQSVLVTACSSNGPMLSHTTPRYRKPSDSGRISNDVPAKEEFMHNGEKCNSNDTRQYRGTTNFYSNKTKKAGLDSQKMDSDIQKQAAIERELRLQKSLSEECEDLGVDEPSTSDLFPEADLLFDSNHSPSFDQTSQDMIKRPSHSTEIKEVKSSMNLFSDDETSSSLRTDLFEYVDYQPVETALSCQERQLVNGNNTGTESGSSGCEDNTLLPKCATMSEVTLNSPISPEMYQENNLNKYKFKYTNRKKNDKVKQYELVGEIVSSSEDTVGSTELGKSICEDDIKIIHLKDEKCELHCQDDRDSPSGRGARRSVRKLCSCCNGSQDGNISRKRLPTSRPQTPAPHKKAFLTKKR